MSFFKVKNRTVFVASSLIVLWLFYINGIQRFSLQQSVEYLNNELKEYVIAKPGYFSDLVLNLSSSRGVWDERQHRVFTLLRPEHCELSYWMRSAGSTSTARINIRLSELDIEGMTEGDSTVEVFLSKEAPSIIVEIQAKDMTLEQCEKINGYYGGGCWYGFKTRSVRFFTLHADDFGEKLSQLIKQCGARGVTGLIYK
jgi:hypothetical protein